MNLRVVWRAFRGSVGWAPPTTVALRMITWYQANVSVGRGLCPQPPPYNCSNRASWLIRSYGLLTGMLIFAAQWLVCDCSDCQQKRWGT